MSKIEVGDIVRVFRDWEPGENGTHLCQYDTMKVGTSGEVMRVSSDSIEMAGFYWPPFVLELVKKMCDTMSDQERYILGQEACGIEVGDEVRATRCFADNEGGSKALHPSSFRRKFQFVDVKAVGIVTEIEPRWIEVDCGDDYGNLWNFPYFVLEIVKKKDGSVPFTIANTSGKERNMNEQKVFDVTVVERTEKIHEGSGAVQEINRTVLFDNKVSAVTDEAAKQKALAHCTIVSFDNLEITCRPFC